MRDSNGNGKKTAFKASRGTVFRMDPDDVDLVTDKEHPLYDQRAEQNPDPFLVDSILEFGIAEPIGITKVVGVPDAKPICVYGRRRLIAARAAKRKLVRAAKQQGMDPALNTVLVPCLFQKGSEERLAGLMAAENAAREDDDPVAEADKIVRYMALVGGDRKKTALAFAMDVQTVNTRIKLAELSVHVRKAVAAGRISPSAAVQLHGVPVQEQRAKLKELLDNAPVYKDGRKKPVTGKQVRKSKGKATAPSIKEIRAILDPLESLLEGYEPTVNPPEGTGLNQDVHEALTTRQLPVAGIQRRLEDPSKFSQEYLAGLRDGLKASRGLK